MKFKYKDILEGQACCDNCDNMIPVTINDVDLIYCPIQNQIVQISGYCEAYDGFFKLIERG
jgi:hypothetical protein